MKQLLEIFLRYFEFLYSDERYRFTDSRTHGANASLTVTGPAITWIITVDRGQLQLSVAPTQLPGARGFWISLIRQYLKGDEDIQYLSPPEEIDWARTHLNQIEQLFSDAATLESNRDQLVELLKSNGEKQWGPAKSS